MNIPQLTGIVDVVALQSAIGLILLSDDRLAKVPMLPEIKLLAESDQQVDVLWSLPRQSVRFLPDSAYVEAAVSDDPNALQPVGCGLLIEMPQATSHSPAVTGPPLTWEVSVVAFEERNTNFVPDVGIGITAEQLAQLVLDIVQLQAIYGYGTFQPAPSTLGPAHDWMTIKPGIYAWRATLRATVGRKQTARSAVGTATFLAGNCTIVCADPAAAKLYTLDGSMPVRANPRAKAYNAPFAVVSGDVVLVATWTPNKINSEILGFTAP